jgi:hypothetical protein
MIVLTPDKEQFKALNGFQKGVSRLTFIEDSNGFIYCGIRVLEDDDFLEIRKQLLKLKQIEYLENEQAY